MADGRLHLLFAVSLFILGREDQELVDGDAVKMAVVRRPIRAPVAVSCQ
jgi:hypothetical protein